MTILFLVSTPSANIIRTGDSNTAFRYASPAQSSPLLSRGRKSASQSKAKEQRGQERAETPEKGRGKCDSSHLKAEA